MCFWDLLKIPFGDQSFDIVIALRLISHIEAWPMLIAELCRVSRQAVILEYPSLMSINAIGPVLFNLKKRIEGNTRSYRSFFLRELKDEFEANGFQVTACYPQFVVPMVLHRALRGAKLLQGTEKAFQKLRLTRLLGSPVILRCDRQGG
jgi:ubiquinone/menaquinone biosynthesis C-methylase UbiE